MSKKQKKTLTAEELKAQIDAIEQEEKVKWDEILTKRQLAKAKKLSIIIKPLKEERELVEGRLRELDSLIAAATGQVEKKEKKANASGARKPARPSPTAEWIHDQLRKGEKSSGELEKACEADGLSDTMLTAMLRKGEGSIYSKEKRQGTPGNRVFWSLKK